MAKNTTKKRRLFRKNRAKKKVGEGTAQRPRISVFRSNKYIYAQLIDDEKGKTLFSANSLDIKKKGTKSEQARKTGKKLAEIAAKAGVNEVIFDKGRYNYHGRVKALAEGAREGGLKF